MMLPDKLAAGWASAVHRLGGDFDLSRRQLSALSILLLSPVFLVACLVGVSEFSPDSWAYFELSKSIFADRFYTFNTLRSYFSETYSASFPFGYPAILAVTHLLFGADPRLAIGVNLAAATASWFLIMAKTRWDRSIPTMSIFRSRALRTGLARS